MLGRAGQAGKDSGNVNKTDMEADCAAGTYDKSNKRATYTAVTNENVLFGIATLNKFGLPYGPKLDMADRLPVVCDSCKSVLHRVGSTVPRWLRIWTWQTHMARCGGKGGQANKVHTQMKIAVRHHVFLSSVPAGAIYRSGNKIKYEERGLRPTDRTAPGDLTAPDPADPLGRKLVMDTVCTSCLQESSLDESSCSGDYVLHQAEKGKFLTDTNSTRPIRLDPMKRLLPLAANQFGRRGWHFQSFLEELAEFVVCRPTGCRLLHGTFAMSEYAAASYVLRKWGARITWTIERANAANTCSAMSALNLFLT